MQRLHSIIRVLIALPAVTDKWNSAQVPEDLLDNLRGWLEKAKAPIDVRAGACEVLLRLAPQKSYPGLRKLISDSTLPSRLREKLVVAFASSDYRDARLDARDALKTVPYRVAVPIALALASSFGGANDLLDAVKDGKAPARLLQEKAILERLRGSNAPDWPKRVNDLTRKLPPADQRLAALIKTRTTDFKKAKPDRALVRSCSPNTAPRATRSATWAGRSPLSSMASVFAARNAYSRTCSTRTATSIRPSVRSITLKNEKTLTALMLRVEGQVLVVADLEGKEQRIPLKDIDINRETMLSGMPANFADVIPEADLYHIVAYLLEQKAKEPKKE